MVVVYDKQKIYLGRGINNPIATKKFSCTKTKKQLTTNNRNFLRAIGFKVVK